jgi:hypothetical protein
MKTFILIKQKLALYTYNDETELDMTDDRLYRLTVISLLITLCSSIQWLTHYLYIMFVFYDDDITQYIETYTKKILDNYMMLNMLFVSC